MSNSDNPRKGAEFQRQVLKWFRYTYGDGFDLEVPLYIGNPAKEHKFDIVNTEKKMVIECKRYTWTESGNVPSAKMGFVNEAAFYLSFLSDDYDKCIVMLKAKHPRRQETLAEYYYRTYKHLIGKTRIVEFDPTAEKENDCMRNIES